MTLSTSAVAYIERANKLPSLAVLTPGDARRLRARQVQHLFDKRLHSIEDKKIAMRDGAKITIRIYKPKTNEMLPVIIYYHGGGWVINDINTSHESCIELAAKTRRIVVSVDYRLAPEHKFPVPVHDAFDAFLWVKANLQQIGAIDNVSVAGDSAGANLATVVTLLAKQKQLTITSQILLYPVTELSYNTVSYFTFGSGFGLDRDVMQWFGTHYLSEASETVHPYVSPLLADVSNVPRALVVAAEHDVLRDEAIAYAKKLDANGVEVDLHIASGLVHSYFTNNDIFSNDIAKTITKISTFLS